MGLSKKIAHNMIFQVSGRFAGLFFSLLSLGVITRYLGQNGFGNYVTIYAYLQFFSIIADFGLTLMTVQMISEQKGASEAELKNKINQVFSNIFTLRLLLSLVLLVISSVLIWFFPYPLIVKIGVLICSFSFLFNSLCQILQGVFQRNLQMIKPTLAEVITKLAFLIGVYLVTIYNWQLIGVLFFMVITGALHFGLMLYWSKNFVQTKLVLDKIIVKNIIQRSWPIAISIIFNLIYLKADILILSFYVSQTDVGLYGAAYRAIDVLTVFPYLFVGMVLPLLAQAWSEQNKERFNFLLQKGFDALTIVAVPLVFGTWFLSEEIIVLIAGNDFVQSGSILKILIIGLGMIYLGNIFAHAVITIDKQKKMMWGFLFTAVTSLIGYLILIPRYSYWGAVAVTVYSEAMATIIALTVVSRTIKQWPSFMVLFKAIIASIIMALVLNYIKDLNLFVQIIMGAGVYLVTLFLIKGVDKGLVKEILKNKP
jgi:O-antigen/teichoic acid export membrane protein